MDIDEVLDGKLLNRFVLIGNPVGHSLSPVMHNKLYEHMAKLPALWHLALFGGALRG